MVVFINGSFGIGKTTVSRLLAQQLPHSTIYDPEFLGVVLQRITRVNDFQDLKTWRVLSPRIIRLVRRLRGTVVVPMTFSNVSA
jgi:cytidylate kinase